MATHPDPTLRCDRCGYQLLNGQRRCPECGTIPAPSHNELVREVENLARELAELRRELEMLRREVRDVGAARNE